MTDYQIPGSSTMRTMLSGTGRYFKALYWPPTPARLRELFSFLLGVPGATWQVLVPIIQALRGARDIYDIWETFFTDQDWVEMRHPDLQQLRTPAAALILAELVPKLEDDLQMGWIPHSYVVETRQWIQAILEARGTDKVAQVIRQRVDDTLRGRFTARFTRVQVDAPKEDFLAALHASDGVRALEMLENLSAAELMHRFVPDSQTALVHLIVSDEGTFTILATHTDITVLRHADLTRTRVTALLRAWLWLYYWHSAEIFKKTIDYLVVLGKIASEERDSFQEYLLQHLNRLMLYNEHVIAHFHPTEVPQAEGIPALPFASWILMETTLRELGIGYLQPDTGLWHRLDQQLAARGIRRLVLCPDHALAIFPHHAAILSIDQNGNKEFVLDRYETSYLPYGELKHIAAASISPHQVLVTGTTGEEMSDLRTASLMDLDPERIHTKNIKDTQDFKEWQSALQETDAFAFVGHGEYKWEKPEHSYIGLERSVPDGGFDNVISLVTFLKAIPSSLQLVTLAACEIGLSNFRARLSEYTGFATDLAVQCQVPAVVSTLWPVPDLPTILLTRRFHHCLLLGDPTNPHGPLPAPIALRSAQLWLRNLSVEELTSELETLHNIVPLKQVQQERALIQGQTLSKPYAHPYYWASFYIMGAVA